MKQNGKVTHISDLKFDEQNPRRHNPRNIGMVVNSLQEVGFARSIVIDEDNNILAGNGVTEAATLAGIEKVVEVEGDGNTIIAVRRRGLSEAAKQKLKYFDNRASDLAEWDVSQLLADYESGLDLTDLWSDQEFAALLEGAADGLLGENGKDAEPQIDKAAELQKQWGTAVGQVWQLGEHRLAVGDCTDRAVVEAVMRGERAEACITDPPFNVRDDKWDKFDDFLGFTRKWFGLAKTQADIIASFFPDKFLPLLPKVAEMEDFPFRRSLIWVKPPGSQFAGGSKDGYWFDFELIQVYGDLKFTSETPIRFSVFDYRTVTGQEHGAEKPVGVYADIVAGYTQYDKSVYEPFSGTGSNLIACHNLKRRCRGIEISPSYAAVSLQRFFDASGIEPKLL